jgi:hypothetical protein
MNVLMKQTEGRKFCDTVPLMGDIVVEDVTKKYTDFLILI